MLVESLKQKLIFVLGKGGVGRTTVSTALAEAFAARGEKTLVVQWSLQDSIAPRFGLAPCGHSAVQVRRGVWVMNFSPHEAIREYFVDHLGLAMLHRMVVENRHVQKLIQAAPGIYELFFLGRLFWLTFLQKQERGWAYDRIIVDSPATGHGVSLFTVAQTVASFGIAGPLVTECERVVGMLSNRDVTGTIVVTLPEELPVEETVEFVPRIDKELRRPPLAAVVNRSVGSLLQGGLEVARQDPGVQRLRERLHGEKAREGVDVLIRDLDRRSRFERIFRERLGRVSPATGIYSLPDVQLARPFASPAEVIEALAQALVQSASPVPSLSSLTAQSKGI